MWLRARRTRALLGPLAAAIGGEVQGERLVGAYRGYRVEGQLRSGYPIDYTSTEGSGPADVNSFLLTLLGVSGGRRWHCQSSASSYAHDVASRLTAGGVLGAFRPGEFKFEGVDLLHDAMERIGEKLVGRLGLDVGSRAGADIEERLVAGGLFDELAALRFGPHPYLPKAEFLPGARELFEEYTRSATYARMEQAAGERIRAAGFADVRSALAARAAEADAETPGRLLLEVEAGKDRVPGAERFRELLERAVRIAEINAEANPSAVPAA